MIRFRNLTSHINLKQAFSNFLNVLEQSLKNSKTGEEKVIECKGVISLIPLSILLQQLISIPVTPFGMGSREWGVVRGGMWNY